MDKGTIKKKVVVLSPPFLMNTLIGNSSCNNHVELMFSLNYLVRVIFLLCFPRRLHGWSK